jgi:hypothetical protein
MGRLVVDAIEPYARDAVSALSTSIFFQVMIFPYAFWILEYRRVQSWKYSLGICLGMRPRNLFGDIRLRSIHSLVLRVVYLMVTAVGLITPIALFDLLQSYLYALAKSAFQD